MAAASGFFSGGLAGGLRNSGGEGVIIFKGARGFIEKVKETVKIKDIFL